jgi:hypothetical protein
MRTLMPLVEWIAVPMSNRPPTAVKSFRCLALLSSVP